MKAEKIQDFKQKAFDLLSLLEGFKPRAYYDSEGIPHIGYGFNLKISTNLYALKEEFDFIGNNKQSKKVEEYQDALEKLCFCKPQKKEDKYFFKKSSFTTKIWDELYQKLNLQKSKKGKEEIVTNKETIGKNISYLNSLLQNNFPFSIQKQKAQTHFSNLIAEKNKTLQQTLKNNNLLDTYELISLLSMFYNNEELIKKAPNLDKALRNNNRFLAWFEIRYNSNKGKDIGIAKRRFAESNVFGLFDGYKRGAFNQSTWKQDKKISFQEALDLYINLYSKFEKEGKNTYFEYIRYYEKEHQFSYMSRKKENGDKIKLKSSIFIRWQLEERGEIDPDFKYHYLPYIDIFTPFAEVLKNNFDFKGQIESKLSLVDRIIIISSQAQTLELGKKIEALVKEEIELRGSKKADPKSPLLDIYIIFTQEGFNIELKPKNQVKLWVYFPDKTCILISPDKQGDRGDNIFLFLFEWVKKPMEVIEDTIERIEEYVSVNILPIVGSANQSLKYQSDGIIAKGSDEEGNSQDILYSFDKKEGEYSPILRASSPLGEIQICNLCFKDFKITQEKQKACNISFYLPPLQTHSTDSSDQELHQAIKKSYEKSQAQFYVYLYNLNTFEPLSGVRVEYGGKESVSSDEGMASFSFEISSPWDTHKIYPISILSPEYSSFSSYACSIASSSSENDAYRIGLLKNAEMSYKDKTFMFDFSSYKVKEIVFPSKDLKTFVFGIKKIQELEKDFFKSCIIRKPKNSRNYIKIEKGLRDVAYITYKREKLTYMDMGFILEERDYRHLCDALEKEDIDVYSFKDEGEYFYLKDISISSSFGGRSASNGVDDTLKLKANFSKTSPESKNTQWGYITFARGVQVQKELYALRKANTLPIEQVEGFEILKNEKGEEIKGEEISMGCLFEWKDRQVLIFGYTNTPSLNNSILLLPTSTQKEDEEIVITSLESNNDEEYLKFSFPSNPTQNSQSLMQCDEFMVDDLLCSLQALSLKEEEEGEDDRVKSMDKELIKKYLKRFSKEIAEGKREVEFERELDDLFIHTSENAKSTTSKINQNKSKVEEALLEDGTKVTRGRSGGVVEEEITRVRAFMRVIKSKEGGSGDLGYETLVGGKSFIKDYNKDFTDHPKIVIEITYLDRKTKQRKTIKSTASGAYQILLSNWEFYSKRYGIKDFSPINQDRMCLILIKYKRNALGDIKNGDIKKAIEKCNKEWASLPDAPYGQPTISLEDFNTRFLNFFNEEIAGKTDLYISSQEIANLIKQGG